MPTVTLRGKGEGAETAVAMVFDLAPPRSRIVVKELNDTAKRLQDPDQPATALVRLCAAAVGLCSAELGAAMARDGITLASAGYSALAYGGLAYDWLTDSRQVPEGDLIDAGMVALKVISTTYAAHLQQQEDVLRTRKGS